MEYKIGEIFEYNGEWYQCIKGLNCLSCVFNGSGNCDKMLCSLDERTDSASVFFKKLEKVGEPVTEKGKTFQKLISNDSSCKGCVFNIPNKSCDKDIYVDGPCPDNEIWVEIKQNKEDMEEKKLNLKPFDIQKAREGKPVCTRDGRKARIVCFDLKDDNYPLAAAVEESGKEEILRYTSTGHFYELNQEVDLDLMMLPEKKEGWAKVRKDINLYDTKEEADRKMIGNDEYVTAKVFWEE